MVDALTFRYAARSHVGKVRTKNDDSAYAGRYLAVVADGMGGHAGGDVASASTVLELIHLDHGSYFGDAQTQLADEIQTANSLLSEMVTVSPKLTGMGTTVTALLLSGHTLAFAHIGDSRAYRLKNGAYEQMSVDHTFVQRLIEEGRLAPHEAENHPHKNVLMRVLGDVDASPELDLANIEVTPGERWLLCSDGLNFVPANIVENVVRSTFSLEETANNLIDLTLEYGAPDNVTVVVLEIASADFETGILSSSSPTSSGSVYGGPSTSSVLSVGQEAELGKNLQHEALEAALVSRPHELVGAAITARAEGKIPAVQGRTRENKAAALLTHRSASATPREGEYVVTEPARRRSWIAVFAFIILVLGGIVGAWFGYAWTQTQYYVGESEGKVAIFNGVSQSLGPFHLSHVYRETPIEVATLPAFARQRLQQTLPATTLLDANQIVEDLRSNRFDNVTGEHAAAVPLPSPSSSQAAPPSSAKPSVAPFAPSTTAGGTQ